MSIETRKLKIIEGFLKNDDPLLLDKVEALLREQKVSDVKDLSKFSGIWSKEEADEMNRIITDGCEQIDHEDW